VTDHNDSILFIYYVNRIKVYEQ